MRKKYNFRRRSRGGLIRIFISQAPALLLFIAIAAAVIAGTDSVSEHSLAEEQRMAEDSIRRAAVSCYAIEGRYPESFDYLADHYGVTVDTEKYIVHYEIFASNIMPEITVVPAGTAASADAGEEAAAAAGAAAGGYTD